MTQAIFKPIILTMVMNRYAAAMEGNATPPQTQAEQEPYWLSRLLEVMGHL